VEAVAGESAGETTGSEASHGIAKLGVGGDGDAAVDAAIEEPVLERGVLEGDVVESVSTDAGEKGEALAGGGDEGGEVGEDLG
jgi:hypothetical protein